MNGIEGSPIMLTGRDIALLRNLHEVRLLDREQIQRLAGFGSVTRANERLSRLHSAGLLRRFFLGTEAGGRKALYALSPRGANAVGLQRPWMLQRADDELLIGEAFVEHQLAVNWCWINAQSVPNTKLLRFLRFSEPISQTVPLAPDGYCELEVDGIVHPIFFEVDLGTESSRVWARKVDLYLRCATSGEFEQTFHQPRFKVAVVCTSERRLQNLRRVIRSATTKIFYFSLLENINRDGLAAPHWLRPAGEAREPLA
jgi:hypothetical protein